MQNSHELQGLGASRVPQQEELHCVGRSGSLKVSFLLLSLLSCYEKDNDDGTIVMSLSSFFVALGVLENYNKQRNYHCHYVVVLQEQKNDNKQRSYLLSFFSLARP